MIRITIIYSFLLFPILGYGQVAKSTDERLNTRNVSNLIFASTMKQASELANSDIKKGNLYIVLISGIAPVVNQVDSSFEKNYKIQYFDFGCSGPSAEMALAYNKVMFNFLTDAYGKKWIKSARKDIIGLKDFKRHKL